MLTFVNSIVSKFDPTWFSFLVGSPQRIRHEDPVQRGVMHEVCIIAAARDEVQREKI